MNYHIITYGCQMNKSDSERIAAVLEKTGHKKAASEKNADLFVLNACSVRQSAVDRIYGKIKQIKNAKRKSQNSNSKFIIILTGCSLESDKKKLKNKVDLIFNIGDLPKLPKLLKEIGNWKLEIGNFGRHQSLLKSIKFKNENGEYLKIKPEYTAGGPAYVPIMTGCDNFCSYCVVPYTRGREKSRPASEIIKEIKTLIKNGFKEIILLGQNVNSYKSEIQNPKSQKNSKFKIGNLKFNIVNFSKLLEMINDIPGDFKISFITAHPKDMTTGTIKALKLSKMSDYLHLPVQSGSNRILKLMNRHYTAGRYLKLLKKIRAARPDIKIGTDIIVGFPQETKKDFQKTVQLCKKAKFEKAYIAQYSPRPETLAAKIYPDNIPLAEKKRRWRILDKIINKKPPPNGTALPE